MAKKWIKRFSKILLCFVLIILVLILLIYLPPVQNYAQRKGLEYISRTVDMEITMDRLRLNFPLHLVGENVRIIKEQDTILQVDRFGLRIKFIPLIKGNIEATGVFIENGNINTGELIAGTTISGYVSRFDLDTHIIQLSNQIVPLEKASLKGANLNILFQPVDTIPQDTTKSEIRWFITLDKLNLEETNFRLQIPNDTIKVDADVHKVEAKNILVDLGNQLYELDNLTISGYEIKYDKGKSGPITGFDLSHIALSEIEIEIDSVSYHGMEISAGIREIKLLERSGLRINSANGRLFSDRKLITVPQFTINTPYSTVDFRARTRWDSVTHTINDLEARLNLIVGKEDLLIFTGNLPPDFVRSYPDSPLKAQIIATGNFNNIKMTRLAAELPGVFTVNGHGEINNVTDNISRTGNIFLNVQTGNLNLLKDMAGLQGDSTIIIPRGIRLTADMNLKGSDYSTDILLLEGKGKLGVNATYNSITESYRANISIDSIQLNHFLRIDSIGKLVAKAQIEGKGLDFTSPGSITTANMTMDLFQYRNIDLTAVNLEAQIKNSLATATINSDNRYLVMEAWGEYLLGRKYIEAKAAVNIAEIDIYRLGIIDTPMKNNLSLSLSGVIEQDSSIVILFAGDLQAKLRAKGTLSQIINVSTNFAETLSTQIREKQLDHKELRRSLPNAFLSIDAGQENPVSRYLRTEGIGFADLKARFIASQERGLNGGASIHSLKIDTFQLDSVYVVAFQDTARINLRAGITNGPKNPHATFKAIVTGEIRTQDAEATIEYITGKGETGLLLGASVKPVESGVAISFIPEHPIIANREFSFNEHNRIYVRNNGRVLADVELLDAEGMGLRVHSLPDTTYLQNLDIELRRINLDEISHVLPYYPSFGGILSMEATFQQTEQHMNLSAEATINDLEYENNLIGNIGLAATWLPGDNNTHYVDGYLSLEDNQILVANGSYQADESGNMNVNANMEHFPLYLANAFIPDHIISISGDIDGVLAVRGTTHTPLVNGELLLDSVTINSTQYGVDFTIDNRPLQIKDSRITFDKFAIYSTTNTDNPFTIDGIVDFQDITNPSADLSLLATNYRLLDARQREGTILYGKVFIDLNSTIKGPLSNLIMRGNVNLLGNTNAHYVLTDSPLTVQDRLNDLVVFTSFSDTLSTNVKEPEISSFTGLDIALTINIDQAVQLGIDLSTDRSSYVDVEGGGNLSFQYTTLGDMLLTGRYTLSGGSFKYSLPVIPLKEFSINEGSYVEWTGDLMDPAVNVKATERVRASVAGTNGTTRTVSFDVSVNAKNSLNDLDLVFDIDAPEDGEVQQQLQAMAPEERSKQAVALMATGIYLAGGSTGTGENFELGAALNNVIQGQLANLAGSALKAVNITFGMENYDDASGESRTAYNFKYSQRLFNDRVQVIIGGSLTTDDNMSQTESFIDNVSLEYRLDRTGTRYIRVYHDKNYESILEGEVIETGAGLILRRKVNRLKELFIFKKKQIIYTAPYEK